MYTRCFWIVSLCLLAAGKGRSQNVPLPYPPIREADVMWARTYWRVIDFREKMNLFFYYPQGPDKSHNFIQILQDAILVTKKVAAYDPLYDDFRIKLTPAEVMAIWTETLYQSSTRPYPPYDSFDTVVVKRLDPGTVKRLKIKEYCFFDKYRSRMETRIVGICPVMERRDQLSGELRGYSDMFWVYFPELRYILANEKLNLGFANGIQTLTYDDVFTKRYFSSYLYKEDNVHDRSIPAYLQSGMDALLESERIQETIRLYEHDLWEQ